MVNILIVDDLPANLLALRAILDELGHRLVEAQSGEQALELLLREDFAVVLLDVQMHGLDGFETAQRIRRQEKNRHTPIIFLTAYDDNRLSVQEAYALGAVDYLVKPLVPVILRAKVAGFVELFQKTEQVKRQAEQLREMQRREFDLAVREQREWFRVTLSSIGDAVITTDTQGRVTFLNGVAVALTGWNLDEATGQPLETVFRVVNEQSRQPVENPAAKALRENKVVGLANHSVLIARDGTERAIDDSAAPIRDEAGNVRGVVMVFRDVTERRQAERALRESEDRYRTLFSAVPVAVFVCDAAAVIQYYNERAVELWGRQPECGVEKHFGSAKLYLPDGSLLPPDQSPIVRVLRTGSPERNFEVCIERPDGSRIPVLVNFAALKDVHGRITGAVTSFIDIADRKRAEEALRAADQRKDEFLATLAHELRNPLAPVRNAVELLKLKGPADPDLEKSRDIIDRQVSQMVRLIDDLLDVARISRNKLELRKEIVDLADVVQSAVETSRPLIEAMGHKLLVSLPPGPVPLSADPTRLAQVFLNLLNNAAKYTEPGGQIRLAAELVSGGRQPPGDAAKSVSEVIVSVKDTGIGIAADQLPHVFELFVQVDRSLEREQSGLGIGLTLVRQLVMMHGGKIEARSEGPGKGSEFVVRLPLAKTATAAAPKTRFPALKAAASSKRRILLVDDNKDSALTMSMLLRMHGHDTFTAHDGHEAMTAAEQFRPEAVLLDIGLPKMNGYDVCRRIREQPWGKEIILVAVTGWGQEDDKRRSHEAGFNHHLVKPVDHAALMKLLGDI